MNNFKLIQSLPKNIFRAYDIRGIVNESLTPDVIYTIARAIASQAAQLNVHSMIVARDGRLSSEQFAQAAIQGFLDSGLEVINIGETPTPLMYFATHFLMSNSGLMITGSHNPSNYNGLKIVIDGNTLADQGITDLYTRAINNDFIHGQGKLLNIDINSIYIERIINDVSLAKPLKIVVDGGNSVAGPVACRLYRQLGCEVIELYCDVDGSFPNHHPDPSQTKNLVDLIAKVKEEQADLGFAFDGDGDRLGVVTNTGEIIWPDRQLMGFAVEILQRCPEATILFDVKCSSHLQQVIRDHGGVPLMWKTGHSYIKNKMKEVHAALAGEMSGHIFFKDRWYGFDDALYSGARLLEIISRVSQDANSFFNSLPNSINTPELNIPLSDDEKFNFMNHLAKEMDFPGTTITTIDGMRVDFNYGFGLVRPSNTTPNLVLRFEADTLENLQFIQSLFKEKLLSVNPSLNVPF